jgi:hypothetical protein
LNKSPAALSDAHPAMREISGTLPQKGLENGLCAWSFYFPLFRDDAQDKAEHGRYLLLRFLDELVKNP